LPRLFFHIQKRDQIVADDEGQQFPNLDDARIDAIASIRDIVAERVRTGKNLAAGDSLQVADEAGNVLLTIPFGDVVNA
jgi:hypothetical protein